MERFEQILNTETKTHISPIDAIEGYKANEYDMDQVIAAIAPKIQEIAIAFARYCAIEEDSSLSNEKISDEELFSDFINNHYNK